MDTPPAMYGWVYGWLNEWVGQWMESYQITKNLTNFDQIEIIQFFYNSIIAGNTRVLLRNCDL